MGNNPLNPVIRPATVESDGGMALSESIRYGSGMEGEDTNSGHASPENPVGKARGLVFRARFVVTVFLLVPVIVTAYLSWRALVLQTQGSILVAALVGVVLVFLVVSVLNAVRSRSRIIDGVELEGEDGQSISGLVDTISVRVRPEREADSMDEIFGEDSSMDLSRTIIAPEFNAAVVQVPRWGVMGGYRNQLVFGLPFLQAVSFPEFRATLAQEVFLFFGGGDDDSAWAWRTRDTWDRFLNRIGKSKSVGALILGAMLGSTGRKLLGLLNPVCKKLVMEADRFAVEVENDEQVASALARIEVVALQYEKAWKVFSETGESEDNDSVYARFETAMRESYSESDAQIWLGKSLLKRSSDQDAFPALVERLEGIDSAPGAPVVEAAEKGEFSILPAIPGVPVDRSAATHLFSEEQVRTMVESFRAEWFDVSEDHWKLQHPAVKQAREVDQ